MDAIAEATMELALNSLLI